MIYVIYIGQCIYVDRIQRRMCMYMIVTEFCVRCILKESSIYVYICEKS